MTIKLSADAFHPLCEVTKAAGKCGETQPQLADFFQGHGHR